METSRDSDSELARRIGTGSDRAAEAEFYRRMAPRVRLYGLRHLRNASAAEDLMQRQRREMERDDP